MHRVATNKTPALEYYFVLSLSTLCTHSQDHNVEIRTLLTSHTLYQQTNTTMDKFLIRKSQATDAPVAKKPKLRKYDESYLKFGFTVTGTTEQRSSVFCVQRC